MDAVIFDTPQGKCYVQPHHIVGAFTDPNAENCSIVICSDGHCFNFNQPPQEVWEQISGQMKAIISEKQQSIAEMVAAMTQGMKVDRGDLN